jgi:hypothetical protein
MTDAEEMAVVVDRLREAKTNLPTPTRLHWQLWDKLSALIEDVEKLAGWTPQQLARQIAFEGGESVESKTDG